MSSVLMAWMERARVAEARIDAVRARTQEIEDQGGYTLSICWEHRPADAILDRLIDLAHETEPDGNQVCCIGSPNADACGVRWVRAALEDA